MKGTKGLFRLGMRASGAMLAFSLSFMVLAGCENGVQEVEGSVNVNWQAIAAPVVEATAITGGVRLAWDQVVDASSYSVWRKDADSKDVELDSTFMVTDPATGKKFYYDLVADDNKLVQGTAYTYTVIAKARSNARDDSQWTGTFTPTNIPAKGTKLAAPTAVTLALDDEKDEITVTVTPPASGNIPNVYNVEIYKDGSSVNNATIIHPATTAVISWIYNDYQPQEGTYTARVTGGGGVGDYYASSDIKASAGQKYEALFGSSVSANVSSRILGTGANSTTIVNYSAYIGVDAKPDVTYTVKRALLDTDGNPGTYAAISLYADLSDTTAISSWKSDALGNLQIVFDKSLPATAGSYRYEVTATKGAITQKRIRSSVKVDPRNYIYGSISVGADSSTVTGTKTYSVTPSVDYKNALQTGDKLVLYYVKSNDGDAYQDGPYIKGPEFSKAELEAATITPKLLTVSGFVTGESIYVQAYLEYADGTRKNVSSSSNFSWNWSYYGGSAGISYVDNYWDSQYIYYAVLNQ